MSSNPEARLERIEKKIDDLSEAFISLARAEEKLATIERDRLELNARMGTFEAKFSKLEDKLNDVNDKIHALTKSVNSNSLISGGIKNLVWLSIAAVIGAFTNNYFL